MSDFQVTQIRKDFPVLQQEINGKPLVYFDNGATAQKPEVVIRCMDELYRTQYAPIHRSVNWLSDQMTTRYENARETVRKHLNAYSTNEIIFTNGTTSSINLLAASFGRVFIRPGDEIILSVMEHHSNIVPWQMVRDQYGAVLKIIPISDEGELDMEAYEGLLNEKTRIVAVSHVSNTLGTVNPVKEIVRLAHEADVPVLLDGAQAIPHQRADVTDLDCDFYAFSGHKVYGPTGIGVLYGKEKWLEKLPPWQGGGEMIDRVTFEKTTFNELPFKFEAGTMPFTEAVGLATALDYVNGLGLNRIIAYEEELVDYGMRALSALEQVKIFGRATQKVPVFSFLVGDIHQYDTGMVLDKLGIAVRTGSHCTMPLMDRLGITGTVRASLSFYNTTDEIDVLVTGLKQVIQMFS